MEKAAETINRLLAKDDINGADLGKCIWALAEIIGEHMPEQRRKRVIKQNKPAVVQVITDRGKGTGSIIRSDGLVLTCKHVIRANKDEPPEYFQTMKVKRITGESKQGSEYARSYDATLVAVHERYDLALLKIDTTEKLPTVTLAPPDFHADEGDDVLAMGYPLGLHHRISEGILSQDRAVIPWKIMLDTTAAINAGNSGGPLFHVDSGLQIGVNTSKYETYYGRIVDNFAFAQPMAYVWEFLNEQGIKL